MAFKKSTFTSIKFPGQPTLDITKVTQFDDGVSVNNDRGKTFDGPDMDNGQEEPDLSLEIRYRTDQDLVVKLRNGLKNLTADGFTVIIRDGNVETTYTGCFHSSFKKTHSADGKPVIKMDIDVTDDTVAFV